MKGEKPVYEKESVEHIEEKKKGLWDNIHAKRKRGEKPEGFKVTRIILRLSTLKVMINPTRS